MSAAPPPPPDQHAHWNGVAGRAWVDARPVLDRAFAPFETLLLQQLAAVAPRRVLDVGCGAGGTTLAVARALGPGGASTGIDISEPLITAARDRAAQEAVRAEFLLGDAQTHPFEPAAFDAIVSRFGVMFFADPVAAFGNLRRAAATTARLAVVAWRSAADNPFMTVAERAAAPLLPALPPRRPDGPGQFAFADRTRVQAILEASGWASIDLRPVDLACEFPAADLTHYITRMGPVGVALATSDDATRRRVIEVVGAAFQPFVHGDDVRFTGAGWLATAAAR